MAKTPTVYPINIPSQMHIYIYIYMYWLGQSSMSIPVICPRQFCVWLCMFSIMYPIISHQHSMITKLCITKTCYMFSIPSYSICLTHIFWPNNAAPLAFHPQKRASQRGHPWPLLPRAPENSAARGSPGASGAAAAEAEGAGWRRWQCVSPATRDGGYVG